VKECCIADRKELKMHLQGFYRKVNGGYKPGVEKYYIDNL
jgi:hypothetical protein